jgi:hypothetical protein
MRSTFRVRLAVVSLVAGLAASAFLGSQVGVGAATNTPVDHFICYGVSGVGSGFKLPSSARLTNKLTSSTGVVSHVGTLGLHCAPVQQRASSANAGITNPSAYQACWSATQQMPQPANTLRITNQFGTATLVAKGLVRDCVPTWSWIKASGKPTNPAAMPPGLSHFSCYSVAYAPGSTTFHPPALLLLDDAILGKTEAAKVAGPKMVCIATTTVVTTAGHTVTYQIQNAAAHLLCFAVAAKPVNKSAIDRNQFGTAKVSLTVAKLLCEPSSSLTVVPPTTTTVAPTTTATTLPPPTTSTTSTTTTSTTTTSTTTTTTEPPTTTTDSSTSTTTTSP